MTSDMPPKAPTTGMTVEEVIEAQKDRPDAAVPLIAGSFFLGLVVSAVGLLALGLANGPTVPAEEYRKIQTQLAGEREKALARAEQLEKTEQLLRRSDRLQKAILRRLEALEASSGSSSTPQASNGSSSRPTAPRVVAPPPPSNGPTTIIRPPRGNDNDGGNGNDNDRGNNNPRPERPDPPRAEPEPIPTCAVGLLGLCILS